MNERGQPTDRAKLCSALAGPRGLAVICFALLVFSCGTASFGGGHPISITQVSAYVQREKVTLAIDLFLEDLLLFHDLRPTSENRLEPAEIARGIERHKRFLLERVQVLDAEGQPLPGQIIDVKSPDFPEEGIPLGDLMSYSLTYTIEYPLQEPPRFLTFHQQLVDPALGIPAEMTLRVKQAGVEGDRVWALQSGKPEVVDFDWDLPPPSPEASEAEWQAWMEKKREATLGITSYSSIYAFFYVEDDQVRHEILVPLLTLEESVLIPRDDDRWLDLEEQEAAREQIAAFFKAHNPVTIDGRRVEPEVARIDFYGLNFIDFAKRAEAKPVGLANARVGVILRYATERPPEKVMMEWDFYNDFIYEVQAMVYSDESVAQVTLTDESPETTRLNWQRTQPWEPPDIQPVWVAPQGIEKTTPAQRVLGGVLLMGIVLLVGVAVLGFLRKETVLLSCVLTVAAAGLMSVGAAGLVHHLRGPPGIPKQEQTRVFRALHRNLYQAFAYRQEEPLYDSLAISVDGPLLRKLYLQIRKSLVMEEQGGAVSRIRDVRILNDQPAGSSGNQDGFRIRSRWQVEGTVEHWGHIHGRTNTYDAIFTVAQRGDSWKIVDVQLLQEEQTAIQTRLRGLPGKGKG